jgi:hypothetical protein
MIARTKMRFILWLALAPAALLTVSLHAQMGMGGNGEMAEKVAENSKKLKQYTHLQKTEVFFKEELRKTSLARVHYDSVTGEKFSEPLDAPAPEADAQGGRRRVLGQIKERKIEEKKDEMKEYIERLTGLMSQYLPPNADRLKAAMPHAQVTPPSDGVAKIVLADYLKAGDKMTLFADPSTKTLSKILVNSSLDSDPVSFQVDFSRLPDGTNYPASTSIDSPAKELRIQVTTSDYHK